QGAILCEGVETQNDCLHMKNLGCKIAQGYSFSRPLAVPAFEQMFRERDGYFELPWEEQDGNIVFAPEHINIEILPESQIRSITQSFVHIMPYGIAGFDEKTKKILFATKSFFELTGYSREELVKMHQSRWDHCLHATYTVSIEDEEIQRRFDSGQTIHMEYYLCRKDQNQAYVSMDCGRVASPEWGSYVLCSFFDQTEEKATKSQVDEYQRQVELEREHADQRMQTVIDIMGVSINEYDFHTGMMHMPPKNHSIGMELLGKVELSLHEFMQEGLIHPDYRDAYLDLYKKMETEDEVYFEYPYRISDGTYHWVSFTAKVAIREHGKPMRYIGVTRLIENPKQEEAAQTEKEPADQGESFFKNKWMSWKKPLLIWLISIFMICGLISIIFMRYQCNLEAEFHQLAESVNAAQGHQWTEYANTILRDTVQSSVLLIIITILAGLAVFYLYTLQKKELSMAGEQYAVLSEFSDTVLFQYLYSTDTLEITPNAKERFELHTLQKKEYLRDQKPALNFYPNDWLLIKEAFDHPLPPNETRTIKGRIKGKSGHYLWCSLQIRYLYENHEVVIAVGKITDINSQEELQERLIRRANIDSLTQIYNKSTVEHQISEFLKQRKCGYLIMMDMDNFKQINDTYGHVVGDQALLNLGKILKEIFRSEDAVGRIGGDEFIAFLPDLDQRDIAEKRMQQILDRLEEISAEMGIAIALSMGVASFPHDGTSYQELYAAADEAMYQTKSNGKRGYHFKE
ncbi:MAG: diguanylate cyclase, partial [Hungatella sp.]